ncbi:MAG: O-antigen ligase family protein [Candidatus Pacebacteria bacterium]|nr:O-antigen ligase family protein [Candidatus Paceibacterota bacterium]
MGKRSREKKEKRGEGDLNYQPSAPAIKKPVGLESIYLRIIEWGTYLALFTPFVLLRSFYFPYVSPKTIFFRIVVDVMLIAYVLLIVSFPKYRPKLTPLTIAITVFVLVSIISSLTGVNLIRSFWSTFERMTGILTILHLYVFYIVLTSVFREKKSWEKILNVSLIVGIFVSLYTLASADPTTGRGGTLGNTSFLSAYLLFDIFFALILFIVKKGFWKVLYASGLLIYFNAFFFNQEPTQGAIGAFWGALFLLAFLYCIFYAWKSGKKLLRWSILIAILLLLGVAWGVLQTNFIKGKLADIEQTTSWQGRKVVWMMGFESWKDRPWLGWGPENFNVPFAKHFNPELPMSGDLWYDRVHNIVLDTLTQTGIVGLLSYLAIFGVAILGLWRLALKTPGRKNVLLPLIMIVLLAAYFAQDIWVFDMISSYMIFFLALSFAGFLLSYKENNLSFQEDANSGTVEQKPFNPFLGASIIFLALAAIYYGSFKPAMASNYIVKGVSSSLEDSIGYYQKAISVSAIGLAEGAEQFSRKVSDSSYNNQGGEKLLENFDLAAETMKKAIKNNSQDFRFYLILGRQYVDSYNVGRRPQDFQEAKYYLSKAQELSPNNQQVYWVLSQLSSMEGDAEGAVGYMQKAVDLEPRYVLANWYLAMAYKFVGDYEKASEIIENAKDLGLRLEEKGQEEKLKQVIEIYQNLGKDKELIPLYEIATGKDPKNAQYWAGMAAAYANIGDFANARKAAQKSLELKPSFSEDLKNFLKELPE